MTFASSARLPWVELGTGFSSRRSKPGFGAAAPRVVVVPAVRPVIPLLDKTKSALVIAALVVAALVVAALVILAEIGPRALAGGRAYVALRLFVAWLRFCQCGERRKRRRRIGRKIGELRRIALAGERDQSGAGRSHIRG